MNWNSVDNQTTPKLSQFISQCTGMVINKLAKFKMTFYVPCSQGESVCFPFLSSYNNNIGLWTLIFVLAYVFYCSLIISFIYILFPQIG